MDWELPTVDVSHTISYLTRHLLGCLLDTLNQFRSCTCSFTFTYYDLLIHQALVSWLAFTCLLIIRERNIILN